MQTGPGLVRVASVCHGHPYHRMKGERSYSGDRPAHADMVLVWHVCDFRGMFATARAAAFRREWKRFPIIGIRNFDWTATYAHAYPGSMLAEPGPAQVELLHCVSRLVSSGIPSEEMLDGIASLTAQATGCDACLVYLVDTPNGELVLKASHGPHAPELGALRIKLGDRLPGWIEEHGSVTAIARNAGADPRLARFPALAEKNFQASLSAPLLRKGQVIGVIDVHHGHERHHTAGEIALVRFVGEQLGIALACGRLEEEVARLAAEKQEFEHELITRKLVERAKGILQHSEGLTEEEAYLKLRNESRRMRRPMKELAEAIILGEEARRKAGGDARAG